MSDESHFHVHEHNHADASIPRLRLVLALSATVMILELIGAYLSGSLTLLTDAGHMLVDSTGLAVALVAAHIMTRPRTDRHTWGWARVEVISAAMQASMLLVVCLAVLLETIERFRNPVEVSAPLMVAFALVGLVANAIGLLLLRSQSEHSLNTKAAFLEVLNDTFGSVAVLAAAALSALTSWVYADPVAALVVVGLMAPRALFMLRRCLSILLEATPKGLDLEEVRSHLLANPQVIDVHDLHVSNISSSNVAFTAHVAVDPKCFEDGSAVDLLHTLQSCVSDHFPVEVGHCTIQLDVPQHRDHEMLHH